MRTLHAPDEDGCDKRSVLPDADEAVEYVLFWVAGKDVFEYGDNL
jgi:hypothetical protein